MSGVCFPQDIIRNIFSYGDINDIPKRKMVFDQLLFLKKEFIYHKYECTNRYHRCHYINLQFFRYILEKNRLKMLMTIPSKKLKFYYCKLSIPYCPNFTEHHFPF